jgi:hypothetical protein
MALPDVDLPSKRHFPAADRMGKAEYLVMRHPSCICAKLQMDTDSVTTRYTVILSNAYAYLHSRMENQCVSVAQPRPWVSGEDLRARDSLVSPSVPTFGHASGYLRGKN